MEDSSVFTMLLVCSWALSERLHRSSPRHLAKGIRYVQSLTLSQTHGTRWNFEPRMRTMQFQYLMLLSSSLECWRILHVTRYMI